MVGKAAIGIVEEKVRRALGAIDLGDVLAFVMEKGEWEFVIDGHFAKSVGSIVGI